MADPQELHPCALSASHRFWFYSVALNGTSRLDCKRPSGIGKKSVIGYSTVAEALAELRAKPGVEIQTTKPDAWIIINEPGSIQWSFTPSTHAAHPAVVRRTVKVNGEGGVYIEMSALCQAEKAPCDKLVEEFKELNDRIRQSVRAKSKP